MFRPKVRPAIKAAMPEHAWMIPTHYIYAIVMLLATAQSTLHSNVIDACIVTHLQQQVAVSDRFGGNGVNDVASVLLTQRSLNLARCYFTSVMQATVLLVLWASIF